MGQDEVGSPRRSVNYFVRHWRGELSLGISFWINGVLGFLLVVAIVRCEALVEMSITTIAVEFISFHFALLLVLSIWQAVGIWRSASKHVGLGGGRIWTVLAKLTVALFAVAKVSFTTTSTIPLTIEFCRILAGDTMIPAYQIRVLPEGKEIEFTGGLRTGAARELEHVLNAAPQVNALRINSIGGRAHEARNIARLIRNRGLNTYASGYCLSAATTVFVAGKERVLEPNAKLGFHRGTLPGLTKNQWESADQKERDEMRRAGISEDFINRVLATPSHDIWFPSLEEMQRAGVITSQSKTN